MDQFLIHYDAPLKDALTLIDANKSGFLISIDSNKKVIGVITDGDIRRALIKGVNLNGSIANVHNINITKLTLNSTFNDVCEIFKSERVDFLPVIDDTSILVNLITKKQFHILLLENLKFDLTFDFQKLDKISLEHEIYNRPWGFYKSTILTKYAQAKIITVFPHSELSLQEHNKREEHWVIIKGNGKAILGSSLIDIYPGKYLFVPKGCKHQIINNTDTNIILSEVQLGEYFGEDDIIRYKDKYGRK